MPSKFGGVPVEDAPKQSGSKFGGVPVDEPAAAPPDAGAQMRNSAVARIGATMPTPPPETHRVRDFVGNAVDTLNPIPTIKRLKNDPGGMVQDLANYTPRQFGEAYTDLTDSKHQPNLLPRISSAAGHLVAGSLPQFPFLGDQAKQIGTQAGEGDTAGAAGRLAGNIIPFIGGPEAMGAVGKGLKAVAEPIAETALGIRKAERGFGKTPGRAALDETTAVSPSKIGEQAQGKIKRITPQYESLLDSKSGSPVSTGPAVKLLDDASTEATKRNSPSTIDQINPMRAQLTKEAYTGRPIPNYIEPRRLLDLKRGFNDEGFTNWNPDKTDKTYKLGRQAYHQLDSELDRVAPEGAEMNQRASSLIPVARGGESVGRSAGAIPELLHKIRTPTGALTSAMAGAAEGAALHGAKGGLIGGLIGLGIPQVMSSPTLQMIGARGLDLAGKGLESPFARPAPAIPLITTRRKEESKPK